MSETQLLDLIWAAQNRVLIAIVEAVSTLPGVDAERFLDELRDLIETETPADSPIGKVLATFMDELGQLESAASAHAAALEDFPMDD